MMLSTMAGDALKLSSSVFLARISNSGPSLITYMVPFWLQVAFRGLLEQSELRSAEKNVKQNQNLSIH